MKNEHIHFDAFGGCLGFRLGLTQAGFNIKRHYYSEIEPNAIGVAKYHDKDIINLGSITDVQQLPERPTIVTFGSPCQDFSLAGNRTGLGGKKSSLITEAIRLISHHKPYLFIWENVKGAYSSNDGADFWAIIQAFANIGGYRLEWQLLNTSWFLPQNRERIYLVGHLDGFSKPKVFPFTEDISRAFEGSKQPASCLQVAGNSGGLHSGMTLLKWQNKTDGVVESELAPTLRASGGTDIRKRPVVAVTQRSRGANKGGEKDICPTITSNSFEHNNHIKITSATKSGYELAQEGDGIRLDHLANLTNGKNTGRGRVQSQKAQTLDTQSKHGVLLGDQIRRLTEIECERLQGFPDDWTKYGMIKGQKKEISATQRYSMMGNAVSIPCVREIGKRLLK